MHGTVAAKWKAGCGFEAQLCKDGHEPAGRMQTPCMVFIRLRWRVEVFGQVLTALFEFAFRQAVPVVGETVPVEGWLLLLLYALKFE